MKVRRKKNTIQECLDLLLLLTACLLAVTPYAARLFQYSISIDTEMMINTPGRMLTSWLYHERPGLVVSKYLFGQTTFHYVTAVAGTVILLIAGCLLWNRMVYRAAGVKKNGSGDGDVGTSSFDGVFPLLFLTHPSLAEQFHFTLQSLEVAWAVMLCLAAAGCQADGWYAILFKSNGDRTDQKKKEKKNVWKILLGVAAMVWSFSSYQSLVPLYIAAAAGLYLLQMERMEGKYWRAAWSQVGVFTAAFLLSQCAGKIGLYLSTGSFASTAYVAGMVQWGTKPAGQCMRELYHYGLQILLGQGTFYTAAYLTALAGTVVVWMACVRRSRRYLRVTYVLAGIIFYLTPFLLPLYLGGADQVRAQMTLAFVIAFGWWYLLRLIRQLGRVCAETERARGGGKLALPLAALLALLFAGIQWHQSWKLNQTAYQVYQQEMALSEAICQAIGETGAPEDASVQIVGRWTPIFTEAMARGETIGWSFYEWDADQVYGSTERVIGLWNTLGYTYQTVDQAAAMEGLAAASVMPVWPEAGSVRWDGSMVIVRIGY